MARHVEPQQPPSGSAESLLCFSCWQFGRRRRNVRQSGGCFLCEGTRGAASCASASDEAAGVKIFCRSNFRNSYDSSEPLRPLAVPLSSVPAPPQKSPDPRITPVPPRPGPHTTIPYVPCDSLKGAGSAVGVRWVGGLTAAECRVRRDLVLTFAEKVIAPSN